MFTMPIGAVLLLIPNSRQALFSSNRWQRGWKTPSEHLESLGFNAKCTVIGVIGIASLYSSLDSNNLWYLLQKNYIAQL